MYIVQNAMTTFLSLKNSISNRLLNPPFFGAMMSSTYKILIIWKWNIQIKLCEVPLGMYMQLTMFKFYV